MSQRPSLVIPPDLPPHLRQLVTALHQRILDLEQRLQTAEAAVETLKRSQAQRTR